MAKVAVKSQEVIPASETIDPETGEVITPNTMGATNIGPVDDFMKGMIKEYDGAGYSLEQEDALTPVLAILQDNSGEVKKQHERHLDDAEAGMLIIRSMGMVFDGEKGINIQPFGFTHVYVEWQGDNPGEGIPVGRFDFYDPPADMTEFPHPQDPTRKVKRRKSNMNRLVETREHYANIMLPDMRPFPLIIPFSGSNHACSRFWTNMMKNLIVEGSRLPSFFRVYNLKTIFRKKGANQTWHGYKVNPGPFIRDRQMLELGRDAFLSLKEKPLEANPTDMGGSVDEEAPLATGKVVDPATVI